MKQRVFEVEVGANWAFDKEAKLDPENGLLYFRFFADNKELAQAHADQLDGDPAFGDVLSKPKMVGWAEDTVGIDLFGI
jgi:hypothetical protein